MAAGTRAREAARAAAHETCPRCGFGRAAAQEYCVECGLRLPVVVGVVPALRGRWVRRFGWYPGDWIWLSLATLLVAAAGAAVAIVAGRHDRPAKVTTFVATSRAGAQPTKAAVAKPGHLRWPAGLGGWTVVLASYPAGGGPAGPVRLAVRAAQRGLPEVGVLQSSGFASLHPGYLVVFSGIYGGQGAAETALQAVHTHGFETAYPQRISP